jgi:hypothetical protein
MYEMSDDFIRVSFKPTQITSSIILEGKRYDFHPSQKEGGKIGIDQTSIPTSPNRMVILDQAGFQIRPNYFMWHTFRSVPGRNKRALIQLG